jgi:hypothetical protein
MVRQGIVKEEDLVRPDWKQSSQRADSVVGLFHMSRRAAAPAAEVSTVAAAEPVPAPASEARHAEELERPEWLREMLELDPAIGVAKPAAETGGRKREAQPGPSRWAATVDAALSKVDARPARGRYRELCARLWGTLCGGTGSRQFAGYVFRIGCAVVAANAAFLWLQGWSEQEALRFPSHVATGRFLPLFGECSSLEYLALAVNLTLVAGIGAYWGAAWLETHAEDG